MEIYMDIIKAVAEGNEKPTHIMYRANLSWIRLQEYLDFLLRQDLIREVMSDNSNTYSLTPKGKDALAYFSRVKGELYGKKSRPSIGAYLRRK
jgi:predicted transcriptional regulator